MLHLVSWDKPWLTDHVCLFASTAGTMFSDVDGFMVTSAWIWTLQVLWWRFDIASARDEQKNPNHMYMLYICYIYIYTWHVSKFPYMTNMAYLPHVFPFSLHWKLNHHQTPGIIPIKRAAAEGLLRDLRQGEVQGQGPVWVSRWENEQTGWDPLNPLRWAMFDGIDMGILRDSTGIWGWSYWTWIGFIFFCKDLPINKGDLTKKNGAKMVDATRWWC